jgi:hypothetical protein
VTHHDLVAVSYERFLSNKIYDTYDFAGCPIVLEFRPIARGGGGGGQKSEGQGDGGGFDVD